MRSVIKKHFGNEIHGINRLSSCAYRVDMFKYIMKLEVFGKNHKLFKSLAVHKEGLSSGLRLPEIIKVIEEGSTFYKFTEWIEGDVIKSVMERDPNIVDVICTDLARYINKLYDIGGISPVDNHLKNFQWTGKEVIYIDMKKLLHRDFDNHLVQMSKLCLKNFSGDRNKVLAFLKSYNQFRDVRPLLKSCGDYGWRWVNKKHGHLYTRPVTLEEIINE